MAFGWFRRGICSKRTHRSIPLTIKYPPNSLCLIEIVEELRCQPKHDVEYSVKLKSEPEDNLPPLSDSPIPQE